MSAIPPLSGEKQTSGEPGENDAHDPKPTISLAISKLCDHSIPEGDQFSCLGIADRSRSHRSVYHYQLRLRIHEYILSLDTQEKEHPPLARQQPSLISVAPIPSNRIA